MPKATAKKVSAKSVIEDGIGKAKSAKFILGQVAKKCPGSKADESHIRFYANKMIQAGTLSTEDAAKYGCGKRGRKASAAKPGDKKVTKSKGGTSTSSKKSPTSKKSKAGGKQKTSSPRKKASKT